MQRYSIKQFDGGFIHISGNKNEVVDWYCKHMGLTVAWDWPGMTILQFPCGDTITLEMKHSTDRYNREARVRFCFDCPDIPSVHQQLIEEGVKVSSIYEGPDGRSSFDFYDPCGNRLTAVVSREELIQKLPDSRFMLFHLRIGVQDVDRSVDWYAEILQMRSIVKTPNCAVLHVGDTYQNHTVPLKPLPIILEKMAADTETDRLPASILPMFVTPTEEDLVNARRIIKGLNTEVSEIEGEIRENSGLAQFFVSDLDHNRFSIYYYVAD